MDLDCLDVEVNFKDALGGLELGIRHQLTPTRMTWFGWHGTLLSVKSNTLWRLESSDWKPKKIAGGGSSQFASYKVAGEKMALGDFMVHNCCRDCLSEPNWICQVEENAFWISYGDFLVQIDTEKGEAELLDETSFGPPGVKLSQYFRENVFFRDLGISSMDPRDPQVYFGYRTLPGTRLLAADPRTRQLRNLGVTEAAFDDIHNPALIRPSKEMSYTRASYDLLQKGTNKPLLTNKGLTWSLSSNPGFEQLTTPREETLLLDLNTGESAVLFKSLLRPLMAISSNIVLAINSKGILVLVDWSLPSDLASSTTIIKSSKSRYLLPNERIRPVTKVALPSGRCYFDSSSNMLQPLRSNVIRYPNVFTITMKTYNGGNHIIYPPPRSARYDFADDLSKLLLTDCPLPYDLQLTHSASNTTWNVHYDILHRVEGLKTQEDIARLETTVKNSPLPKESIEAFLKFLYFASPADLTNPIGSFLPICHCIQLCNQVGMDSTYTKFLLWLLDASVLPLLPNETLLQQSLTLWLLEHDPYSESIATYSKESPLMNLLASRCRMYASDAEIEDATKKIDYSEVTGSLAHVIGRCASFILFMSPGSSLPLKTVEMSSKAPCMDQHPLKWDENLSVESRTPAKDKYAYVFTIEGLKTGGIVCNSLLLYPQWRWFERLCKTNCEEVLHRHVVMPVALTPTSLLAIVSPPHKSFMSLNSIPTTDIALIYGFMEQLHLPEGRCFADLVEKCHEIFNASVTSENCLQKLHEFWEAGVDLSSPFFINTLDVVYKNSDKFTFDRIYSLPLRLQMLISAYADQQKRLKSSKKLVSIATALKQCVEDFQATD